MTDDLLTQICRQPTCVQTLTTRQWEALLGQARRAHLVARLARLARQLEAHGWLPNLPPGPRPHLESALRLADRQQHEVHWEVDCIRRALTDLNCPVVLLKGSAYLMAKLPPADGRLFADIDIMVPHEHIEAVEQSLFAAGWISDERDPYNQKYYREWMHEIPPLRHVQRDTYIDLHHTITPPTSRFSVNGSDLLTKIQPLPGYQGFFTLGPTDMVLHSAVHLFQEGDFSHGLRDLLDLRDLLQHFAKQSQFWDQLVDRATQLRLEIPLFHALFHLERSLGLSVPIHLKDRVAEFGPDKFSRLAMAWMLRQALRPMHPSCDTLFTGIARWLLFVRSHAMRMPFHLLVPHLVRKAWMRRFPKEAA